MSARYSPMDSRVLPPFRSAWTRPAFTPQPSTSDRQRGDRSASRRPGGRRPRAGATCPCLRGGALGAGHHGGSISRAVPVATRRPGAGRVNGAVRKAVLDRLRLSAYDLPTRDKVPVIQQLLHVAGPGLALDIGIGTGYTTYSVFDDRPTTCVDVDTANLRHYRDRVCSVPGARRPHCVAAEAVA